jgi:hypothetical protein
MLVVMVAPTGANHAQHQLQLSAQPSRIKSHFQLERNYINSPIDVTIG